MSGADQAPVVLEARGLRRDYPSGHDRQQLPAVRDIDLLLRAGELLVITGPSGSGKTTLLHMLAAIDTPTAGSILLEGRPLTEMTRTERADLRLARLGLVFAEHNLSPALSAAENVDLPLSARGLPAPERTRRVAEALQRLGVGALAKRLPDALSSGEQQRVAVARAIAGDPALLVADEPTAHLDGTTARALVDVIAQLVHERRMAAVVSTHDARLVDRASRVLTLEDGRRLVSDAGAAP